MKTNHIENTFGMVCSGKTAGAAAMFVAVAMMAAMSPAAQAQAQADTPVEAAKVSNTEIGHSTHAWLELQRSNAAAAPAQPMLGAEAGYAWQRYMKSFETPIPASFGSTMQSGGAQGSSSSGSSGGGAY
ncbi:MULTISPECIES: DUF3613 domain-containing protein [unclassified Paraburkholderia]|uniref:DUF3613 domain-containing protein n=1 Tax=unclassified Paraburkholderia TaxID=2615204 RepID=UPI002AAF7324|nr:MULTISPECIES: DUF3613 domain-containing protein [unclassified Paraburkholderia]